MEFAPGVNNPLALSQTAFEHRRHSMARPMQDCVILLGDSLTQRMDAPGSLSQRMHEAYSRRLDVLNRGYGGYTSVWVRPLIDHIFAKKGESATSPRIRLVTIWLGTNDSVHPIKSQHVPLDTFTDNINHLLSCLTSPDSPYAVADTPVSIILITPGPPVYTQMDDWKRKCRSVERTGEFRQAVLNIGREWKGKEKQVEGVKQWKLGVVDFWDALIKDAGGLGEELEPYHLDGVHLTTKGYDVLWKEVVKVIKTDFKGRGLDFDNFDDLPFRVPWWDKVDPARPESVIEGMALPPFR